MVQAGDHQVLSGKGWKGEDPVEEEELLGVAAMSPLRTQERRQCGREGRAWASKDGKISGAHPRRPPSLRPKGEWAVGSPPVCMWATGVLPWAECSELEKLKQAAKINRIQIQKCMSRNANL